MIYLGVDLGARRVGLAVSDPEGRWALPDGHTKVRNADDAFEAVRAAAARHGAGEVVVGLPRKLNGREGPEARAARAFVERCKAAGLSAVLWDERLTSGEAHQLLREAGLDRRQRGPLVDAVAAQRLLSSYLDCRARTAPPPPPPASASPETPAEASAARPEGEGEEGAGGR